MPLLPFNGRLIIRAASERLLTSEDGTRFKKVTQKGAASLSP